MGNWGDDINHEKDNNRDKGMFYASASGFNSDVIHSIGADIKLNKGWNRFANLASFSGAGVMCASYFDDRNVWAALAGFGIILCSEAGRFFIKRGLYYKHKDFETHYYQSLCQGASSAPDSKEE